MEAVAGNTATGIATGLTRMASQRAAVELHRGERDRAGARGLPGTVQGWAGGWGGRQI